MPTLRELRIRSYLSQEELARVSSVPRESISRFENGHKKPGRKTLQALALALGVEPVQISFSKNGQSEPMAESGNASTKEKLVLFRLVLDNGIRQLLPAVPDQTLNRYFGKKKIVDYIVKVKSEIQNAKPE
jgi:transcriptional regulator with XRE-family HTH domain